MSCVGGNFKMSFWCAITISLAMFKSIDVLFGLGAYDRWTALLVLFFGAVSIYDEYAENRERNKS